LSSNNCVVFGGENNSLSFKSKFAPVTNAMKSRPSQKQDKITSDMVISKYGVLITILLFVIVISFIVALLKIKNNFRQKEKPERGFINLQGDNKKGLAISFIVFIALSTLIGSVLFSILSTIRIIMSGLSLGDHNFFIPLAIGAVVGMGIGYFFYRLQKQKSIILHREKELVESLNRYKNIFDNALVAIFRSRLSDGLYLEMNAKGAQLLGTTVDKVVGKMRGVDLYRGSKRRGQLLAKLKEFGEVSDFEMDLIAVGGKEIVISITAKAFPDKDYMEGVAIDITARKKAEERLEVFKSIAENTTDAIMVGDISGNIYFANKASYLVYGYNFEKEELLGLFPTDLGRDEDKDFYLEVVVPQLAKGGWQGETLQKRKDGSLFPVSETVFFIRDLQGKPIGIAAIVRDITEQKKKNEQLHQSRKMDAIGQLAGGVAHDFNNMLTGIMGAAQLLQLPNRGLDNKSQELVDMILISSERAANLTSKLLSFSRKGKIEFVVVDLELVISDALDILSKSLDKKVKVEKVFEAGNSNVLGDGVSLQNLFMNLGINAAQAMDGAGEITFILSNRIFEGGSFISSGDKSLVLKEGEYLNIEVRDNGNGIPQEYLEKIFEPFFTTKEQGKGTGLGLSSVYATVEEHSGSISVYSEEGIGTTFNILLPCVSRNLELEKVNVELKLGSGLILLVDDEELLRITVQGMLEDMGYEVITAKNGREAVELFKERQADISLVMMDMLMPEMNGRDAFLEMKKFDNNCKIIIVSGFSKDEHLKELDKKGLSGFLKKPFRDYELSQLLFDVLNNCLKSLLLNSRFDKINVVFDNLIEIKIYLRGEGSKYLLLSFSVGRFYIVISENPFPIHLKSRTSFSKGVKNIAEGMLFSSFSYAENRIKFKLERKHNDEVVYLMVGEKVLFLENEAGDKLYAYDGFLGNEIDKAEYVKEIDFGNIANDILYRELEQKIYAEIRSRIGKVYRKKMKKTARTIAKIKLDVDKFDNFSEQFKLGDILKSQLYNVKRGMAQVKLEDWSVEGNPIVTIELNPSLLPADNLAAIYKKASKSKRGLNKAKDRLLLVEGDLDSQKKRLEDLEGASPNKLLSIFEKEKFLFPRSLRIDKKKKELQTNKMYWSFEYDNFRLYIGKNAKGNEFLSFKKANGNDMWLHAHNYPGSHIILKRKSKSYKFSDSDIAMAAIFALFYSKAPASGKEEVVYTEVKNLGKIPSAPTGTVRRSAGKVIQVFVDDEIISKVKSQAI